MSRRFGPGVILLVFVAAALSVLWLYASGRAELTSSGVLSTEPSATSVFLAAYERGDLAEADNLASPLYRAEWTRRRLSLKDREALLPTYLVGPGHPSAWVRFTYVGGVVDESGFGHILYAARATGGDGNHAPTAWRVDTDRNGRVIWIEMVGLFTESNAALTTISPTGNLSAIPLPTSADGPQPCLAFGVRSSQGPEGYYVLGFSGDNAVSAKGCSARVVFFAVDEYGLIRPAAWTFGQSQPGLVEYGHAVPLPTVPLPPVEDNQRTAYLASLP